MDIEIWHLGTGKFIVETQLKSISKPFDTLEEAKKVAFEMGKTYNIPWIDLKGSTLSTDCWIYDDTKEVYREKL